MTAERGERAGEERRVLDEAGGVRTMAWVLAIMLFLTLLAAALGLATRNAGRLLERQLAGRLTVQVVDGDPGRRDAAAARVLAVLRAEPAVTRAVPVSRADLQRLLAPWLGGDGSDAALPVPAMIDVDLANEADVPRVAARVEATARDVRVDRHAGWMSPVSGFMASLTWLAGGLVLTMLAATAAMVMLAVRAGLERHRGTIEVMHMLGSTDVQVARLFQRRIAIDAGLGAAAGAIVALGVALLVGGQLARLGSELLGGVALARGDWIVLAAVPVAFVVLAMVAARTTVLSALRRTL